MASDAGGGGFGDGFPEVLAAAQAGAAWALTNVFETLAPAVAGYLRAQRVDDADDLTSEVFLRVFANIRRFGGAEAAFRSWVFTIAHNRLVDQQRQRSRRPTVVPMDDGQVSGTAGGDTEDEALVRLGERRVRELLAGLPDDQRAVLLLRVVADLTVEQVAAALGKTPGAVKALQRRALVRLRRQLAEKTVPL